MIKLSYLSIPMLAFVALVPLVASAQPDETAHAVARQLGTDGVAAYQAGEYEKAADDFERAYALLRVPTLGYWSAKSLDKLGKLVAASERYQEVRRLPLPDLDRAIHEKAQADAKTELEALTPRIPHVVVEVKGVTVGATLTLNGHALQTALWGTNLPVDPGTSTIVAQRGSVHIERVLDLSEGQAKVATIDLGPLAEAPAPSQPGPPALAPKRERSAAPEPLLPRGVDGFTVAGGVVTGVGAAGVVVGSILGSVAIAERKSLNANDLCRGNVCLKTAQADVSALNAHRWESTTGFIVGGVGLTAGITMLLLAPKHAPEAKAVQSGVTFDTSGVSIKF